MKRLLSKLSANAAKITYLISFASTFLVLLLFEVAFCNGSRIGLFLHGEGNLNISFFRLAFYLIILALMFIFRRRIQDYLKNSDCLNKLKGLLFIAFVIAVFIFFFFYLYGIRLNHTKFNATELGSLAIFFLLTGICIVFLGNRTEKNFLIIGFTLLLALPFITQMLHGVDEYAHFTEAYNLSLGHFFNWDKGVVLPQAFNTINFNTLYKDFIAGFQTHLDYSKVATLDTNGLGYRPAGYPFFFYIPSAIGLAIGRLLNFNIAALMYIGRVFNLIVYVFAGYFIIKLTPYGKNIFAVVMLSPYLVLLSSTYSIDGFGMILILLFVAYCFHISYNKIELRLKEYILLVLLALSILMFKGASYSFVFIFTFLIPAKNLFKKDKLITLAKFLIPTLVIIGVACLSVLLYHFLPIGLGDKRGGATVDEVLQFRNMIQHPVFAVFTLCGFWVHNVFNASWLQTIIEPYFFSTGSNVFIPMVILWVFVGATDHNDGIINVKETRKLKIFILIYLILSVSWIAAYFYLAFTPVGSDYVAGMNCRYIFPLIPLAFLLLNSKSFKNNIKHYNQIVSYSAVLILFFAEASMMVK